MSFFVIYGRGPERLGVVQPEDRIELRADPSIDFLEELL